MALVGGANYPSKDPVTDRDGLISIRWGVWFRGVRDIAASAPQAVQTVRVTGQSASIPTTPFSTGSLAAGVYKVSVYLRVTQAATTSSSILATIGFTDGAVACVQATAALTGNTVSTNGSQVFMVRIDGASPVTYATTYASVGGTPMLYNLDLVFERVGSV